jgi:hypothetical protein
MNNSQSSSKSLKPSNADLNNIYFSPPELRDRVQDIPWRDYLKDRIKDIKIEKHNKNKSKF